MRVLVAGTRSFGIACAQRLTDSPSCTVVGVVSPLGDSLTAWSASERLWVAPAVGEAVVRDLGVDLIVGAHCHDYLGRRSRGAAKYGALIGHPSLLPRHRGRDAVEWTIRMRDPIAGFSWFMAESGVDTGPVVSADWCHVDPRWNASDLWRERLFPMGVNLLERTVAEFKALVPMPQKTEYATWEPALENVPPLERTELWALPPGPSAR